MLSKYIKELIENNNRIIIPDFGAFMIQETPKGKQISFNDFLKFNDGLLINQIIKSEKISKNEATDKVKEFIKGVEKTFGDKKTYELKGIGFIYKDDHSNIKFSVEKPADLEASKVAPTDVKPTIVLDEKAEAKKEEPKPESPKKEEPKPEPQKKEEPKTTKSVDKKPEPVKEAPKPAATPISDRKKPIPQVPKNKPQAEKPKTANKPTKPSKPVQRTQKSDGNLKNILIIVGAVIILGGGTWAIIHFGLIGKIFNKKTEPVAVEQATPIIDTVPEVVEDTTPPEPEPKVEEEPQVDPNVKKYYVVAGSFKVPTNATNFNEKLIEEGYDSEIVVRSNGFHIVSYKTVYNWNDAVKEWKEMRNTNTETWIFIK